MGFWDIDTHTGYLDRLYVHSGFIGKGIGSLIADRLEKAALTKKVYTHAPVNAKPFFEKRGYKTVKEQLVERKGILLTNFVLEKTLF